MTNLSDPNYIYTQGSTALNESGNPTKFHKSDRPTAAKIFTNDSAIISPQSALNVLINNNPGNISPRSLKTLTIENLKKSAKNQPCDGGHHIINSNNWKKLGLEDFIVQYNKSRGDLEMKEWAFQKLEEMEQRGGLKENISWEHLDIPAARLGLIDLTTIANQEIKFRALNSLYEIVNKYPITKEYYEGLLEAMSSLHEKMPADFQQHQVVELQIEFAKNYGAMAELILRHYAANLCNGITEDLKYKFKTAIDSLKMLNRQDDPCLSYYAKFALEGIIRLKDDRQELKGIFGAIYHFALAGTAVYFEDGYLLQQELPKILNDIKINIKHSWYEKAIRIREMGRYASSDLKSLENLLQAIEDNRKSGWKFIYTGIETLSHIAIHGATKQIRKTALRGCVLEDKNNTRLPGLLAYTNYSRIKLKKIILQSKLSLRKPKVKDPNAFVRLVCLKNLIKIAAEAPDQSVRMNARSSIVHSLNFDTSTLVKKFLTDMININMCIPNNPKLYRDWINEEEQDKTQLNSLNAGSSQSDFDLKSATEYSFESASNSHTPEINRKKLVMRRSLSALDDTPEFALASREKRRSLQAPIQNHRLTKSENEKHNLNSAAPIINNIAANTFDAVPTFSFELSLKDRLSSEFGARQESFGTRPDSSNEVSVSPKLESRTSAKNLGRTT